MPVWGVSAQDASLAGTGLPIPTEAAEWHIACDTAQPQHSSEGGHSDHSKKRIVKYHHLRAPLPSLGGLW